MPQLPLGAWQFTRYGEDKPGSIETTTGYANQWDTLMGGSLNYTSDQTKKNSVVAAFNGIASNRNACYLYPSGDDSYFEYKTTSQTALANWYSTQVLLYPDNTEAHHKFSDQIISNGYYSYKLFQQPAFMMQYMAYAMSENLASGLSFWAAQVVPYLDDAKSTVISARTVISHPHYPISYYLLATKITA